MVSRFNDFRTSSQSRAVFSVVIWSAYPGCFDSHRDRNAPPGFVNSSTGFDPGLDGQSIGVDPTKPRGCTPTTSNWEKSSCGSRVPFFFPSHSYTPPPGPPGLVNTTSAFAFGNWINPTVIFLPPGFA